MASETIEVVDVLVEAKHGALCFFSLGHAWDTMAELADENIEQRVDEVSYELMNLFFLSDCEFRVSPRWHKFEPILLTRLSEAMAVVSVLRLLQRDDEPVLYIAGGTVDEDLTRFVELICL